MACPEATNWASYRDATNHKRGYVAARGGRPVAQMESEDRVRAEVEDLEWA